LRYRPLEELKTLHDLTTFDAVCIGGPLNGTLASLGCLPVKAILSLQENCNLAGAYMRSLPYRMPKHMKYCVSLLNVRHRIYVAWIHESTNFSGRANWEIAFDSAVDEIDDGAYPQDRLEQAPFKPGDLVVANGDYPSNYLTVRRCFHRDGKWWFVPDEPVGSKECACYVMRSEYLKPPALDEERTTLRGDEVTTAIGNVLRDDQIFGPSKFFTTSDPGSGSTTMYGIDMSKIDVMSMQTDLLKNTGKQDYFDAMMHAVHAANIGNANRNVAPFHPGELVRFKADGVEARVEKTQYLDDQKCWAVRLAGHKSPYNAKLLERAPPKPSTPRDVPPAPAAADERPRRRVIRKGERK
jgi:hypothetical protein